MRRYLYFFIIVAVIILIVLVFLFLRNRAAAPANPEINPGGLPGVGTQSNPPSSDPGSTDGTSNGGTAPSYIGQKFGIVAQNKVLDYRVDPQNNVILVQPDGQIAKVSNGNATILSSSAVSNLSSASFSYDGNKILAVFGDAQSPQVSVFDVQTKSWGPLAQGVSAPAWSPTDNQIVYFAEKTDGRSITTLDLANPKAKPVELMKIRGEDLLLNWINPTQILVYQKPSAIITGSAWVFNIKNKTLTPLLSNRFGMQILWEKTTNVGLVSGDNTGGLALSLVGAGGETLRSLSFATLLTKCSFSVALATPEPALSATSSSSTATGTSGKAKSAVPLPPVVSIYCAIPRDAESFRFARLPDDYLKKKIFTADDFYMADLGSGTVASVFSDQGQMLDATNLKIFNKTLFFVNRIDQKLYAISLK